MSKFRYLFAGLMAVVVTLGAFYLMHVLIASPGARPDGDETPPGIRFQEVQIDDQLDVRDRRKPKPPPPPKEPPPPPKMQIDQPDAVVQDLPQLDVPKLDLAYSGSGVGLPANIGKIDTTEEGDIIPLVKIRPQYPRDAAIRRLEGWVKVQFTITPAGTVTDPSVLESKPSRVFDREAIRAILKWKFKPKVVDGTAVPRRATQIIDFKLAEA